MEHDLIVETFYDVRRSDIEVDPRKNRRRHMNQLPRIGRSLERRQVMPLVCVPTGRDKAPRFSLRDGNTRITSSDKGFCPKFTERDSWWIVVLRRSDGSIPSDREVHRWCETVNTERANWTEIEEAEHFRDEIEWALNDAREKNPKLGVREESRIRAETIRGLAQERNLTDRTIRYRLKLLTLPPAIQDQLAAGTTTVNAVKHLIESDLDEQEMVQAMEEAAELDGVELDQSRATGDSSWDQRRPSRHTQAISRDREGDGVAVGRIKSGTLRNVVQRRSKTKPKPVVRPLAWFQAEIERVTSLAAGKSERAKKAKIYLQALRLAIGDTDKTPV